MISPVTAGEFSPYEADFDQWELGDRSSLDDEACLQASRDRGMLPLPAPTSARPRRPRCKGLCLSKVSGVAAKAVMPASVLAPIRLCLATLSLHLGFAPQ